MKNPSTVSPPIQTEPGDLKLCIIENDGLFASLIANLRLALEDVAKKAGLTWPEFKKDPLGFSKRAIIAYDDLLINYFAHPWQRLGFGYFAIPLVAIIVSAVLIVVRDNNNTARTDLLAKQEEAELISISPATSMPTPDPGTAGMNKGKGGGSKPKQEKPGGGGGGGREEQKPASFGKTPQASLTVPQVVAPDPDPPRIINPSLPVAATVVADPLLVPPDAKVGPYGDQKSKSTDPSSGPGTGNGIGDGKGGGIGPGEGGGIGPGRGGNIGGGDRNDGGGGPGGGDGGYSGKDVHVKVRVLNKPEPQYTEEARKNHITGMVVLTAIFKRDGTVTNIKVVSGLPFGLDDRAIAAARKITFLPAQKDGKPVNQYLKLEYNFNLY